MNANTAQSMSLRARINAISKRLGISPQLALQSFFSERFLARIAISKYVGNLAIKGGTLVSDILGINQRTTMDIDTTLFGMPADQQTIARIVSEIAAIDVKDGIIFHVNADEPATIRKDDEYSGFSIRMIAILGTIRLPISIDVTYGDIITPTAVKRDFKCMLEADAHITLYVYPVETLIAEKLQTILKREVATTRPRDFYDLYMLAKRDEFSASALQQALANTIRNRKSEASLARWREIVDEVGQSDFQREQWQRYQRKTPYAKEIEFTDAINTVKSLLEIATTGAEA